MLKVSAIICSVNRREQLHYTVNSILRQLHLPAEILISVPDESHVFSTTSSLDKVKIVCGPKGLTAQRNTALAAVSSDCDIVLFLDDDIELCPSFITEMAHMFEMRPNIVMGSGTILKDGRVDRDEAIAICKLQESSMDRDKVSVSEFTVMHSAYGCNAAARWRSVRDLRFDERLPLYGWLEDRDYSFRAASFGQTVMSPTACAVHLAIRTGRISEVRFGYSQIVNSFYLWRKNGACSLTDVICRHWVKQVAANVIFSVFPEKEIDRRGRLRGNLMGFVKLLTGRCEPEYILNISERS